MQFQMHVLLRKQTIVSGNGASPRGQRAVTFCIVCRNYSQFDLKYTLATHNTEDPLATMCKWLSVPQVWSCVFAAHVTADPPVATVRTVVGSTSAEFFCGWSPRVRS